MQKKSYLSSFCVVLTLTLITLTPKIGNAGLDMTSPNCQAVSKALAQINIKMSVSKKPDFGVILNNSDIDKTCQSWQEFGLARLRLQLLKTGIKEIEFNSMSKFNGKKLVLSASSYYKDLSGGSLAASGESPRWIMTIQRTLSILDFAAELFPIVTKYKDQEFEVLYGLLISLSSDLQMRSLFLQKFEPVLNRLKYINDDQRFWERKVSLNLWGYDDNYPGFYDNNPSFYLDSYSWLNLNIDKSHGFSDYDKFANKGLSAFPVR